MPGSPYTFLSRTVIGAGVVVFAVSGAWGQGDAPPPPPVGGDTSMGQPLPAATPAIPLDEAVPAPSRRDPFWPVGYVPRKVEKPKPAAAAANPKQVVVREPAIPEWEEAGRRLDIRGISHIGREKGAQKERFMAVVNGKMVEPGDTVSVTLGSRVYRWRVQDIKPGGLSLTKLDVRDE